MAGGWWDNLVRRARLRGLKEGLVQTARAESLDNDAKDAAERFQDYGFAAQPVDGQGLVINAGGHTIVLRMDRLAERPQLAAYEVSIWHKEGHRVTLRGGRLVEVDCDHLVVNASAGVTLNTPVVTLNAPQVVAAGVVSAGESVLAPVMTAADSLTVGGQEMREHTHGGVDTGSDFTGPPA